MTVFFPILMIFGILSCLPAWFASSRRRQASRWTLFAILPGLAFWVVLASAGVGPQSLSNLVIELLDLVLGSVVLYYLKVFLLDRVTSRPGRNTGYMIVLTFVAATMLRLLMPELPG